MIKSVKRLGAAVLSAVMMLTAVATPLGDNLPAVRESTSLTASASDWKRTFINNKSNSRINSAINAISNQANVSKCNQSGKSVSDIIRFMIFDSKYAVYGNNAILDKYTIAKYPTCQGSFPEETVYGNKVSFTKAVGCLWYARYVTTVIYGKEGSKIYINKNSVTAIRDFITKNAQAGEHIRMEGGTYQHSIVYVSSDSNGFYYLDYFGNSGDKPRFTYTTYTDFYNHVKSMSTLYLANANNGSTPSTDNVKLPGISSKKSNTVSDTNAFVVTDVYKPSNYKLTKAGIRIRREDGTYDNGWSEFHNTASTWTGYDYMYISYNMNSEVKITLRHGTKYYYKFYAVIEGKEYWSPEQSFTTTGSHSYGSWYTKTSATCTSGGTEERKCSCGATESRSTSALGHNYGTTYFEADHPHKYAHLCQRCGYKEFTGGNLDYYYLCATCTHLTKPEVTKITGDLVDNSEITIEWTASESDKLANYWLDVFDPDGQNVVDVSTGKINSYTFTPVKTGTYTIKTYAAPIGNKDGSGSVGAETTIEIGCNHNYNTKVVKPTFESEGYTQYTCTKCGYSYKGDYIAKLTKPNPVSGLTYYNRSADTISVKWGKVSNADGYILEWLNGNKFEKAASFTANDDLRFTFKNLSPATMYKFRVRCYKVSGGTRYYSDYSTVLNVKTYPQKISKVKQTAATESSVTVWWDKTESARGYVIEKLSGTTWERVITLKDGLLNTYTFTGLNPSTEYQFRIKRYVTDGEKMLFGAYSEVYTATTSPKTPVNFAVSAKSSTYFTFKWDKDEKADGYEIQQYTNGEWTVVAKTYGNTYTVKNLKAGTAGYKFRLRAYIEGKDLDAYSNCSSVLTLNTNPYGVGGFKCSSKSSTSVTLKWNKGTTASGYQLQQYKDGKWVTIYTGTKATNTSYTVKGLKAGTAGYRFRIRAYKTYGNTKQYGSWSSEVKVNTNPYGVGGFKCSSKSSTSVTLKWNKGTTASGYQLQQYKGGKWVTIYTGTKATNTSYTVKKLKAGTAGYRFRIRAYKTYGNTKQYGSWSSEVKVNTNPYGVGGFKAKSTAKNSITLGWNKGTTASGYQLQQYKGGKWVTVYTGTKATSTSCTVKSLKANTSYKFRIRAYKTYGSTKQYGSWSKELTVKTKK